MPIKYKILKNRKFVYAVGEGQISFDDLLQHVNELAEDPKYVSPNLTQTKKLDGLTVEELIEQFKLVREDTIAIVQGMSEQDLNREGMHAFHGHGKLERFIIWAYEHVRIHEDEIRKVIH
ncbi:MAG: DinB family protein [Desulfobacterales bacterium]|uniref:DinB family protein n=1 Tax=Candidatus Desulfatibia vada TaxID=2841696 RepID=A0A8J6P027_9BACT|nr:DinB family protein [Candidatus Desulfatibia vada]